ncbi:MAG: MATE family efflux transporter [Proteobacteria bacterium]|nr:MATE family efflux transporter [Pseudomonadota bacterium]MBU4468981.1 MATE family efflux transporter [Pseudomonadota bacterium]MCG2752089.1 MATE family efflux transporter [Desulfobacteraceae bacterium]
MESSSPEKDKPDGIAHSGRPLRRNPAFERDLTKGSISANLWALSWPTMISSTIFMIGPMIDMIWVGKLGSAAIAGVGVSGMAVMVIMSAIMGLNTGNRALLARFVGAGDQAQANHVAQQSFVISVIFAIIMAIIGIFHAEFILTFLGVKPDVVKEGADYMRVMFVGAITMSMMMMATGIMQASGDAIAPMKVSVSIRIFHMILCPFLVFGWWIFPEQGVKGAAMSNVLAQGLGAAILLWYLLTGRTRLKMSRKNFYFDRIMIWRIIKVGFPSSITGMERTFANFILMWLVVPFGTAAVAAQTLSERIDGMVNMPAMGLGQASGVLAAQNLGAGKPERAEKTAWTAVIWFSAVTFTGSIFIYFFAENIVHVFNKEQELVGITANFLRINIVSYLVFGVAVVLMNSLNGVGDTSIPMWTTMLTMWLVQVPMAYFLPRMTNLGVYGIRWGIVTGIVIRAVVYTFYFKGGRWKNKMI